MIDTLAATITLACIATATAVGLRLRAQRWRVVDPVIVAIQIALVVQAILAGAALLRGNRPGDVATFVAYLMVSVVALPVAATQVRDDAGRWAGALVIIALLALAVVVMRAQTVWRSA